MLLGKCFDAVKCDKESRHGYGSMYQTYLIEPINNAKKENRPLKILEIGIFKGASMEAFINYFDEIDFFNFELHGIDTFQRVKPDDIPVFNHFKVRWYEADSTKEYPVKLIQELPEFDMIIDDGLHTPDAQRMTFINYSKFLRDNGVYIIEDVWPFHKMSEEEKKHPWLLKHPDDYSDVQHQMLMDEINDWEVHEFDNRKNKAEDSFAFIIRNR